MNNDYTYDGYIMTPTWTDWVLSKSKLQIVCIIKNYYLSTRWIVYFKFINSIPLKIHTFTYYRYVRTMQMVWTHFRILVDHIHYEYCTVRLYGQYGHWTYSYSVYTYTSHNRCIRSNRLKCFLWAHSIRYF